MTKIVGIDLGTTHSALAYAELDQTAPRILHVRQEPGRSREHAPALLPSALFHLPAGEPPPGDLDVTASDDPRWLVGIRAVERGRDVPGRYVSSTKSWLCHDGVDRTAAILPWGSELDDVPRLSPVEASRRILSTFAAAFHEAGLGELSTREVVLTVPASFDEVARELTVRAAREAGLGVRLLEEPQAAFYDFLAREGDDGLERICPGEAASVLVCDVGGGTTDLSLIRITRTPEGFDLERVAVGRHLLLGGDNVDLALAHLVEPRLVDPPSGGVEGASRPRLDASRFAALVGQCRKAKEQLLAPGAPDRVRVAVAGSGASLVGSTKTADVTRDELERLVFDGFFPAFTWGERPKARRGTALVAFGLPYESDAAITRHISEFLARHLEQELAGQDDEADASRAPSAAPLTAVLYNGGPFQAERLREHLHRVLETAIGRKLSAIVSPEPELAVARGAVAFGRSLHGTMPSITGGAAHGYYVGVSSGGRQRALCVVPRGSKEGERHHVDVGLSLRVGQPARFELFALDSGPVHRPGHLVELSDEFEVLPPLATAFESRSGADALPVAIEGELTAIGTLDLSLVDASSTASATPERFRLAFELRGAERPKASREASGATPSTPPRGRKAALEEAYETIQRVFGKGRKDVKEREVKDLLRNLERVLGARRDWSLDEARAIFDVLGPKHAARRRSPDHERVYWLLSSYCLRPGLGHPLDKGRVAIVSPLLTEGLTFGANERAWQQLFIAWRRLAPGLDEAKQVALRDRIDPFLAPASAGLKKPKGFKPLSLLDALDAASWLERIPVRRRTALADWILERTWTSRDPRLWAALGRLGTRVPLYASAHQVLPARKAEEILDHLLRERFEDLHTAPLAATLLARSTGDRARDVPAHQREQVVKRLEASEAPPAWIEAVRDFVPLERLGDAESFGEELPPGLVLDARLDDSSILSR